MTRRGGDDIVARRAHGWLPGLSTAASVVLLALWDYADPTLPAPVVWPSRATLEATLGLSRSHVARALRELRAVGAIEPSPAPSRSQGYRLVPRAPGPRVDHNVEPAWSTGGPGDSHAWSTGEPPHGPRADHMGSTGGPCHGPRADPDQPMNNQDQPEELSSGPRADTETPEPAGEDVTFRLESPGLDPDEPDPRPSVVVELWETQEHLRRAVAAELGVRCRGLRPTAKRLRRVELALESADRETCEHVLQVYAAEARASGSLRWLNGETNWRPANFDRAAAKTLDEIRASLSRVCTAAPDQWRTDAAPEDTRRWTETLADVPPR